MSPSCPCIHLSLLLPAVKPSPLFIAGVAVGVSLCLEGAPPSSDRSSPRELWSLGVAVLPDSTLVALYLVDHHRHEVKSLAFPAAISPPCCCLPPSLLSCLAAIAVKKGLATASKDHRRMGSAITTRVTTIGVKVRPPRSSIGAISPEVVIVVCRWEKCNEVSVCRRGVMPSSRLAEPCLAVEVSQSQSCLTRVLPSSLPASLPIVVPPSGRSPAQPRGGVTAGEPPCYHRPP